MGKNDKKPTIVVAMPMEANEPGEASSTLGAPNDSDSQGDRERARMLAIKKNHAHPTFKKKGK